MVDGPRPVEQVTAKRDPSVVHSQPSYDYTNSVSSIYEDLSDDISQPITWFGLNAQDDQVVIHTENGCSCHPDFCLTANLRLSDVNIENSSYSRFSSSIDGVEDCLVEMMTLSKSEDSGSPTSSSSRSTQADDLVSSVRDRGLDKTASLQNWATTDMGETAKMRNSDSNSEPNLTKEAFHRYVEAKVRGAPFVALAPSDVARRSGFP